MYLFVRTATGLLDSGNFFVVEIETVDRDNLNDVKSMIERQSGIPAKYQKLLFRGKVMDDGTLRHILDYSTIHLAPNGPESLAAFASIARTPVVVENQPMTILVNDLVGLTGNYDATPFVLVEDLKAMIHDREGHKPESFDLVYAGTCLRAGFVLQDYNVHRYSRLDVILRLNDGIGSAVAWKNRLQRVLGPLAIDLPLKLYPKALERVAGNNCTIMFAALQMTLAPVMVANRGRKRIRTEKEDDEMHPI